MLLVSNKLERRLNQPRFSHVGLADQHHCLPFLVRNVAPSLDDQREFLVTCKHGPAPSRSLRLEAAALKSVAKNFLTHGILVGPF
jgi:hypothetical protein